MIIRDIKKSHYFIAKDKTTLCELLHPEREQKDLKMGYSIAHAVLKPGEASLSHRLKESSEVYYIIEGEGRMYIGGEGIKVRPGQAIYIPPGEKQYIENIGQGELKFLAMVSPPWKEEDEEVV